MSMVIDPDAAAYGIFQIAFATMDTRRSRAACEQKIREAIRAGTAMEAAVPHLVAYELDLEELGVEP